MRERMRQKRGTVVDLKPRKCKYCRMEFQPKQKHQEFCEPSHKKMFWKRGSLPFQKMMDAARREARLIVETALAPLRARVEALEYAMIRGGGLRGTVEAERRFEREVLNAGSERTA